MEPASKYYKMTLEKCLLRFQLCSDKRGIKVMHNIIRKESI